MAEKVGSAYIEVTPKLSNDFDKSVTARGTSAGNGFGSKFGNAANGALNAASVAMGNILSSAISTVASAAGDTFKQAFEASANYEQLYGGVEKIFDQANIEGILNDAQRAFVELNMSTNDYLAAINGVGATFAQTMGDQEGYDTARKGMLAIADYASGTGRSVEELNQKFQLISRSSASYQSIADQFAGILPQTSQDFLEQAQAAGFLSDAYSSLNEVPVAEYQQALTNMLSQGVQDLGLAGNTAMESTETLSGSIEMLKSSWENLLGGILDENADVGTLADNLFTSIGAVADNIAPRIAGLLANAFANLPKAIGDSLREVDPNFADMADRIEQHVSDLQTNLEEFGSAWEELSQKMEPVTSVIGPVLVELLGWLGSALVGIVPALVEIATGIVDAFNAVFDFGYSIGEFISGVAEAFNGWLDDMSERGERLQAEWDAICQFFAGIPAAIGGFFQQAAATIEGALQGAADFAAGIPGAIVGFFSNIGAEIGAKFDSVKNEASNRFNQLVDDVKSIPGRIVEFFNGLGEKITSAIGSIHFPQPSVSWEEVGIGDLRIPHISWAALGGFVNGATLVGAGEAGPEMILPRHGGLMTMFADSLLDEMGGGVGTVYNVTIDGNSVNDDAQILDVTKNYLIDLRRIAGI